MPSSRTSTTGARRSAGQPLADVVANKAGRRSRSKEDDKSVIAENDALSEAIALTKGLSEQIESGSLLSFQSTLQNNLTKRTTKRRRRSTQQQGSSSGVLSPTKDEGNYEELSPAWDMLKEWPAGLNEEERAIGDYFRRLKMIQLEQETRSIFVHDTNDDTQTVYTVSDVRRLETEVREVKAQLQARKLKARQMREEIEGLCGNIDSFDTLRADVSEANDLATRIKDTELELARLQTVSGITAKSILDDTQNSDEEEEALTAPPRIGTFTRDEAEDVLNRQLLAMERIEGNQTNALKAIEAAKRQLATGMQSVDRLNAERSTAEKAAREAKAGTRRQRDHTLEAVCRGYSATIRLLHGLVGVRTIDAPNECCLRAVYSVCDADARAFCEEVAIELHFDRQNGDRLTGYTLQTPSGRLLTDRMAPDGSYGRRQMDRAVRANDASLLLQEALVCVEAARQEE